MVSRDTCFLTLVLVSAFLVVSMDARSWDVAVTIGQQIDFFSRNGTRTGESVVAGAVALTGLAYDGATRTMFVTDGGNRNVSIYSSLLAEKDSNPSTLLKYEKHTSIMAIVFDPQTKTLFWTDGLLHAVMKMEISPDGRPGLPVKLHDLTDHSPHGIALDICNRYIYWANSDSSVHSIERSKLDGTGREVVVDTNLYEVYGLAIDHSDGKLYWTDDAEGNDYKIQRSNLDGSETETLVHGRYQQPLYIAVDDETVYWTDRTSKAVWTIKKNGGIEDAPTEFKSYIKSHRSSTIMSIITRDNIGDIDCDAMLKREKQRLANPTAPDVLVTSFNNLTTSTEDVNSTARLEVNCLNNGRYNDLTAVCDCEEGFTGTFCEISVCHNYCVHGKCVYRAKGSPRCICGDLYTGDRCEKKICDGYCLNNGSCSLSGTKPYCKCENSWGSRCEYTNGLDQLCSLYCMGTRDALNNLSEVFCRCSELNETLSESFITAEPLLQSTIILSVLLTIIGTLVLVVGVLSYHVNKLRRRPRIRKRFVVSKGGVTPLTSRPQLPADSCEITIENCCNMNICETPCFEPKLRATPSKSNGTKKEEKNSLLDSMEGADSC